MILAIPPTEIYKIRAHGSRDYPNECCGALLGREVNGRKLVAEAHALTNASQDSPRNRYLVAPQEWRATDKYARQNGLDILGFYHSHPDHSAQPSEFDLENAWPWLSYVILSVVRGRPGDLASWVLAKDWSRFEPEEVATIFQG